MSALAGVGILYRRRLRLSIRTPRELIVPLMTPILFALIVAPALAQALGTFNPAIDYMTFVALATAGLLIPLNTMFAGIGVIVDREQGAQRELLVAPISRGAIVGGNLLVAVSTTALQLGVLILAASLRGAKFDPGNVVWFVGAAFFLCLTMYGIAEMLAHRVSSQEEYVGILPAVAIVPYFFAGSFFPISALPGVFMWFAKFLPLTHALALFRYGLTNAGYQALHDIWGMTNVTLMATLSLVVLALFATLTVFAAVRIFVRAGVR
jgi:ABC-2 type transport system permease protein